jgi:cytoskeletal protein CcmA (bactofilin family)
VLLLAVTPSPARLDERGGGWAGRTWTVVASETIEGDYFAFGPLVAISGTVNGDVYAFGGQVLIDGRVNGDVLAGAGRVSIAGRVSQDVRVAGGQVSLSGTVGRNLTVAGGSIELAPAGTVGGSLVAAGGAIHVGAPVGNGARVAAGTLIVAGRIGRNLDAAVGALRILSSADVQGDVHYLSDREASVDTGARIHGRLTRSEAPRPGLRRLAAFVAGWVLVLVAASFVSTLVLGLSSLRWLPRYHAATVAVLRERPLAALGVGLVAAVVTPVACLLLFASVVGAPIGLILAVAYAILLYWGRIFAAARLGEAILGLFRATAGPGWAFLLGLVVYYLLALIPVIGWVAMGAVILLGFGAELIARRELYRRGREQGIL